MKKLLGIVVLGLLWFNNANAGACNTTVTAALTEQLSCSDSDTLTVTGSISYNNQNCLQEVHNNVKCDDGYFGIVTSHYSSKLRN